MLNRYLGNYKNFKCIADKCPSTCCSGWAIEIDESSLESYRQDSAYFAPNVDWHESCFKNQPNGDCAFLRSDGLCQMIIDKGEVMLCRTCDLYPRHIEEFPGVREYSLSVSCPVAAEDILSLKTRISIDELEDCSTDDEEYEDFDTDLYRTLSLCRSKVFSIIGNDALSFDEKCIAITGFMRNIQDEMDDGGDEFYESDILDELLDKGTESDETRAAEMINEFQNVYKSRDLFLLFYELEPLQEDFRKELKEKESLLFGYNPFIAPETISSFTAAHPDWQLQCENLLTYFIYTYMCGAVYDEYVYAMTAQAVYSTYMVRMLWIADYLKKTAPLTLKEQSETLYQYSRELEHSNENMILLEKLIEENL